jgi:hypothetical protein
VRPVCNRPIEWEVYPSLLTQVGNLAGLFGHLVGACGQPIKVTL